MNEDVFNASLRGFLKKVGITSQREIEKVVRDAVAGGKLKGVDRSFETISRGGGIVIEFRPTKGNALVSALSITSLDNIKGSFREWRRPRSQTSASDAGTLW